MYSDYRLSYKPVLAFLSFCSRSGLAGWQAEDCRGQASPQAFANQQKSTQGREQKGIQKSVKKPALIPYFNNIEITSIKIFAETPEISGKSAIFFLNRNYSKCIIELLYFVVVVKLGGLIQERGFLLENIINTRSEVYLG